MTLIQQIVFAPYEFIQKKDLFDYISLFGGFLISIFSLILGVWLADYNLKRKENRRLRFIRETYEVLIFKFIDDTKELISKQKKQHNQLRKIPVKPEFIRTENPHYAIFKSYDITELKSAWTRISRSSIILNTIIEVERINLRIESINYNNEVITSNKYKETKMNLDHYQNDFNDYLLKWPKELEGEKKFITEIMSMFHERYKTKLYYLEEIELHDKIFKISQNIYKRTDDEFIYNFNNISGRFLNTLKEFESIIEENIKSNSLNILDIKKSIEVIENNHKELSDRKRSKRIRNLKRIANACKNIWKCRYRSGSKHHYH